MDPGIQVYTAISVTLTTAIGLWIAYQQWRTARSKLRLDTYDRKLKVYAAVKAFIDVVMREGECKWNDLYTFQADTAEADFLFEKTVLVYLTELRERGKKLAASRHGYDLAVKGTPLKGYDNNVASQTMHDETIWITNQYEPAKALFAEHMKLE